MEWGGAVKIGGLRSQSRQVPTETNTASQGNLVVTHLLSDMLWLANITHSRYLVPEYSAWILTRSFATTRKPARIKSRRLRRCQLRPAPHLREILWLLLSSPSITGVYWNIHACFGFTRYCVKSSCPGELNKLASLEATRNNDPPTQSLTQVKYWATSVAKDESWNCFTSIIHLNMLYTELPCLKVTASFCSELECHIYISFSREKFAGSAALMFCCLLIYGSCMKNWMNGFKIC